MEIQELYKINQGSVLENLKTFIFLTNEYGKPSDEFLDWFIFNFEEDIIKNKFTFSQNELEQLDEVWLETIEDCKSNEVEYAESYGSLFYEIISNWSRLSIDYNIDSLKQFIEDFDGHVMDGIDMTDYLYFENTPELIKTDKDGKEYIKIHIDEADRGLCTARLYRDSTTIIEVGSTIGDVAQSTIDRPSLYHRIMKARSGHVKDYIVTSEIMCKSPSGAGQVYRGFTCNGWISWYNKNGELIDYYREKSVTSDYYIDNNPKENVSTDNLAEDAARIHALIHEERLCDKTTVVQTPKYSYKLVDEMYIGHELTITESVDDIESQYKAKVIDDVNIQLSDNGLIVDINKFLEEVEGRNVKVSIKMGFFKFEDIYAEEK